MRYEIAGARGRIRDPDTVLRDAGRWASERSVETMLADARVVLGRDHLESAILHARRAKDSARMTTKSLPMETMLYLSGKRQVADAIRAAGLRVGTETVAVVIFGGAPVEDLLRELGWKREEDALSPRGKSLASLGITKAEARTVPGDRQYDLGLEKTALLDVLQ